MVEDTTHQIPFYNEKHQNGTLYKIKKQRKMVK